MGCRGPGLCLRSTKATGIQADVSAWCPQVCSGTSSMCNLFSLVFSQITSISAFVIKKLLLKFKTSDEMVSFDPISELVWFL